MTSRHPKSGSWYLVLPSKWPSVGSFPAFQSPHRSLQRNNSEVLNRWAAAAVSLTTAVRKTTWEKSWFLRKSYGFESYYIITLMPKLLNYHLTISQSHYLTGARFFTNSLLASPGRHIVNDLLHFWKKGLRSQLRHVVLDTHHCKIIWFFWCTFPMWNLDHVIFNVSYQYFLDVVLILVINDCTHSSTMCSYVLLMCYMLLVVVICCFRKTRWHSWPWFNVRPNQRLVGRRRKWKWRKRKLRWVSTPGTLGFSRRMGFSLFKS